MDQNSTHLKIYKTLSDENKAKVERLFNIKRRLLDDSNIKDNKDGYKDFVQLNYDSYECNLEGLSDQDKFILIIIIYDNYDLGVTRKLYKGAFGWNPNYVSKLFKNENSAISTYLTDDDGYLHGRGYILNDILRAAMYELYDEFLWHDISENIPSNFNPILEFKVNIQDIYCGKLTGLYNSDNETFTFVRPNLRCSDIPNWPKEDDSNLEKRNITIKKDCNFVKAWKIR